MAKTIEHTQTLFYQMWKIRNTALHKDEDSEVNKTAHIELNNEIEGIYEAKPPTASYRMPTCNSSKKKGRS